MNIKINRKDFLNALSVGASRSNISKVLTAYSNILLELKSNGFLYITSCDGDNSITTKIEVVEYDNVLKFLLEPKILQNILKSINDDIVELMFSDSNCIIKHEKGQLEVPTFNAEEFPLITNALNGENVKISSDILMDFVNTARLFVSDDTLRPVMCGVYFSIEGNYITVASSDGHRLFTDRTTTQTEANMEFVLHSSACNTLVQLCADSDVISVYSDDKIVTFRNEKSLYTCRKIEARYPNFRSVIPQNNHIQVTTVKQDVNNAVKRSMLTSNTTSNLICLDVKSSTINIESQDIDFSTSSHEECTCEHIGEDIRIGVKGSYFSTVLGVIKSDDLLLEFTSHDRAIVIKDLLHNERIFLLMPLMID